MLVAPEALAEEEDAEDLRGTAAARAQAAVEKAREAAIMMFVCVVSRVACRVSRGSDSSECVQSTTK